MASPVEGQIDVSGKQPIWSDVARFTERSLHKIRIGDTDGIAIPDLLARDLTEDDIIPTRCRNDENWSLLYVERSEKGNATAITSPFTNLSTPHPPRAGAASLSGARVRSQARCRGGLPAPKFDEPDEIKHITVCPGRQVVELTDDLLFYPGPGNLTSAAYDSLVLQRQNRFLQQMFHLQDPEPPS